LGKIVPALMHTGAGAAVEGCTFLKVYRA